MFHTTKKVKYFFTDMFSLTHIISNFFFALPITRKIKTGVFELYDVKNISQAQVNQNIVWNYCMQLN
jgi:hypothetical protein